MVLLVYMEGIYILHSSYIVVLVVFGLLLWVSHVSRCFPLFSRFAGGSLLLVELSLVQSSIVSYGLV